MTLISPLSLTLPAALLVGLVGVACDSGSTEPPPDCGFGERFDGTACAPADHFHLNVDERLQHRAGTTRSGVGVNGCTFRPFAVEAVAETDACAAYSYTGAFPEEAYFGDAGGIIIALEEPVQMLPSEEGDACYRTDLFPTRSDLFAPGEVVRVQGLGGGDYPFFDVDVTAPDPLLFEPPAALAAGEEVALEWIAGDASHVAFVLQGYDAAADRGAHVSCQFDDEAGEGLLPAELTDALPVGVDLALFALRQGWAHVEPEGVDVVIDVVLTSSVEKTYEVAAETADGGPGT